MSEPLELTAIVDRIEPPLAVLEVGKHMVDWPLDALPDGIKEGAALTITVASQAASDADERLKRLQAKASTTDIIDI